MRRRLLLLAGLTCAVAVAVLLRTATSDVEPLVAAESAESGSVVITEVLVADCTIVAERTSGLASSEAAQPLPVVPLDATEQVLVAASDSPRAAPTLFLDFERPPRQHPLSRVTIRPPPSSHTA
jgi:hypothetical protein